MTICMGTSSVFTDNNPLKYVMTTAKLNATGQRWVSQLSGLDFDIQYRRGKCNVNADARSRMSNQDVCKALQSCPQRVRLRQAVGDLVEPGQVRDGDKGSRGGEATLTCEPGSQLSPPKRVEEMGGKRGYPISQSSGWSVWNH